MITCLWSINKIYNDKQTMAHGMAKIQQMLLKQRKDIL